MKPVTIRREASTHVVGGHLWVVRHNDLTVAAFTKGERALNYVDCELSAWHATERRKAVVKVALGLLLSAAAKKRATDG